MPRPKKKIDVNPRQAALNSAFGALDPSTLRLAAEPLSTKKTPPPAAAIWKMGRVVLRRETAHRGGKTVVVIDDFATHLPQSVIERIAKKLRQSCGCGGTVRERSIEMQGDQPAKIRALLEAEGFQVAGVR